MKQKIIIDYIHIYGARVTDQIFKNVHFNEYKTILEAENNFVEDSYARFAPLLAFI